MDESLIPFHRQYLQQVIPSNIRYPPPNHLVVPFVQQQIYRYFFKDSQDKFLPPPDYQRRVLKRIIGDIERELSYGNYDVDDYEVCDALMSHMGELSALPQVSDSESAQLSRTLSYFLPTNTTTTSVTASESQDTIHGGETAASSQRILVQESPNLLAAGSNVGLRTWEASLHLAYYLCTCSQQGSHPNSTSTDDASDRIRVQGANILELGAGTGLLSLISALALGANHVVSTDGLTHVVEGIKNNIALNLDYQSSLSPATRHNDDNQTNLLPITADLLDWTRPEDLDRILGLDLPQRQSTNNSHFHSPSPSGDNPKRGYDLILGADITYHPDLFPPLAHLLSRLLSLFPHAKILISATVRNEQTMKTFRSVCEKEAGLTITEITKNKREKEEGGWKCPPFKDQTGLFHEQVFPIVILEISSGLSSQT